MFKSTKRALAGVAALGAIALGASAIAGAATSSTATTSTQSSTTQGGTAGSPPPFNGPAPGSAAHEDAEKAVTGTAAAKAQAAAVKSVGGGTAGAVTTDLSGSGFETTVTKSGGTKVEVHLDSSYRAMPGPGHGGPPGPGRGGPPG